jgi:hypothetical protein
VSNLGANGGTPLVGALAQYSYLCLDAAGQNIYLYQGQGLPASWSPPSPCGASLPGATLMLLAGGSGFQNTLQFYRPYEMNQSAVNAIGEPNIVQMMCNVTLSDSRGEEHSEQVQTQAVVAANDQN